MTLADQVIGVTLLTVTVLLSLFGVPGYSSECSRYDHIALQRRFLGTRICDELTHGVWEVPHRLQALAEVHQPSVLRIHHAAGLRKRRHGCHELPVGCELLRVALRAAAAEIDARDVVRHGIMHWREVHKLRPSLLQQSQIPAPTGGSPSVCSTALAATAAWTAHSMLRRERLHDEASFVDSVL